MQVMEVRPFVVHQTFQYGGTKGKRHRLREAMLWYDPPDYYAQGQFIHAELDNLPAPADFEQLGEFEMSDFHLLNMRHQLLQARSAFAAFAGCTRVQVIAKPCQLTQTARAGTDKPCDAMRARLVRCR